MTQVVYDAEFGEVAVRRVATSRSVRVRVKPDGTLVATLPPRGALKLISRLIDDNRIELRQILLKHKQPAAQQYADRQKIGQKHELRYEYADVTKPRMSIRSGEVRIKLPPEMNVSDAAVQDVVSRAVRKAVQTEAEIYLPKRLAELSERTGIRYGSLSFNNAKGRWGSCSSGGQIRLNIALMQIPVSLSDYVMVHELCHILEMNHSDDFWDHVYRYCPNAKLYRKRLRDYSPYI